MGGQRLGEMEVWALEAHRAAHTLQEMLTIKSDDIVGRAQAFSAIVKGDKIPEAKIPESFKVLVRELNSLGLSINVEGAVLENAEAVPGEEPPMPVKKSNHVNDPLTNLRDLEDFKSLQIKLASDSEIRGWSRGEITKPEKINYRTLKNEKDGLFDEKIFGPIKDWECYCGKYKRIRYKGVICDKCGVEVTESRVIRERMCHLSLAAPVVHVWFFKGAPSKISLLLDLAPRAIEQVVYFARYLVINTDEKLRLEALKNLKCIREEKIKEIKETYGERAQLIKKDGEERKAKLQGRLKDKEQISLALSEVDLDIRKKETSLAEEEKTTLEKTEELFTKLLDLVKGIKKFNFLSEDEFDKLAAYDAEGFLDVKMGAESILAAIEALDLDKLSVELRKEVAELKGKGTKYIKLTKRLKLVDGLREAKINPAWTIMKVLPVLPADLRPMVQLAGGRFATSDLNDLYRRVINRNNRLKHLITLGAPDIILRNEKRMLQEAVDSLIDASQRRPAEVFDILEEITVNHPVLLNRAPTLHKLGIQAFYPILIEGSAIRIHPAVCSGFNADFDGDQMAVHIPLSKAVIEEAKNLMLSENNLLRPSDGSPAATPSSKEMALGVYYFTSEDTARVPSETIFANKEEAIFIYQVGKIGLRQKISVRINLKVIETTVGRILFNEILPDGFAFIK